MSNRSPIQLLSLTLKGMAMGAADIVPGVSGGTIAFITGIYEELITSINNINLKAFGVLRKQGIKECWTYINGQFFVFLFLGIGLSILTLVKVVTYVLENHPVLIWSFFFGLIVASVWMIGKKVTKWSFTEVLTLLIGAGIAFWISSIQSVANVDAQWFIFLSGAIAICAMILPGISGSFILVLMGSYHFIISGLKNLEVTVILLFGFGCLVGLLSFARILKYLFTRYKNITIAVLTGFMVGSLWKVWPWKVQTGDSPLAVHSDGSEDWAMNNVLPGDFVSDPQVILAIICAVGGLLIIYVLDRFSPKEG